VLYLDDYDATRPLKEIADEYGVGILVVHHTRKASADDPLNEVSGSTGLTGAADTILVLRKDYRQERFAATLYVRGRDVEEQQLALEMEPKTMVWRSLGPADAHRMGQERKQIVEQLARMGRGATPSEVADVLGKKRANTRQTMLRMANQGSLRQLPGGRYELVKGKADEKF
jgi:hypothetical protein